MTTMELKRSVDSDRGDFLSVSSDCFDRKRGQHSNDELNSPPVGKASKALRESIDEDDDTSAYRSDGGSMYSLELEESDEEDEEETDSASKNTEKSTGSNRQQGHEQPVRPRGDSRGQHHHVSFQSEHSSPATSTSSSPSSSLTSSSSSFLHSSSSMKSMRRSDFDGSNWNEHFQLTLELPTLNPEDEEEKMEQLKRLTEEFVTAAKPLAKLIIDEEDLTGDHLPNHQQS